MSSLGIQPPFRVMPVYEGSNDYSKPYCRHGVDYVHDCDVCELEDENP